MTVFPRIAAFCACAGSICALAACSEPAPGDPLPRVELEEGWAQIPEDATWGEVSAVDIDSHGHIFVLQRGARAWQEPFPTDPIVEPVVYMFGADGALLGRWGAGETVMPHGLSVDPQDRVWITDVQREQVLRFSHDGALEMALGKRGVAGDGPAHFGRPADVAFGNTGVMVADGYTNRRIAIFDGEGQYVREWEGFDLPHSVVARGGRVYVANREGRRIDIRSSEGGILTSIATPGHPYAVKPFGDGRFLSLEGRDAADNSVAIFRLWRANGTLEWAFDASGAGGIKGHDFALGEDGRVYVADIEGGRLLTFSLPATTLEQERD